MTKILKRPLSILLAVLMVMSVFIAVPMTASATTTAYVKVTSAPDDWSGDYLIVYENGDNSKAFNGGSSNLNSANNFINVTISNGEIASDDDTNAAKVTIAAIDGGYSIKAANGDYIGGTSGSNGTNTSSGNAYVNSISLDGGDAHIVSDTSVFRYNTGWPGFRYYKSASYASQKPIQLYKLESGSAPTTFKVYVKKLTGGTYTIENLTGETTVAQLKEIIADQIDIPATAQRLIFAGKQLEDAKTLAEYNIGNESTIHLVIRGYTVTWLNYDNSELGTTTVQYGATPSYDGTPERPEDANNTYTFSGWSPAIAPVSAAVTYTAQFTAVPKPKKLTLNVGENGKVVMDNGTFGNATDASNIVELQGPIDVADDTKVSIVEGHTANLVEGGSINIATGGEVSFYPSADNTGEITAIPAEGYVFAGWYNGDALYSSDAALSYQNISENITLTAKFAPAPAHTEHTYTANPTFNWTQDANTGDWDCDKLTLTCTGCDATQDNAVTGFFGASAVTCTANADGSFTYSVSKKVDGVTYSDTKTYDANGVVKSAKQLTAAAKKGGSWELGANIDGAHNVVCANGFVLDGKNHTVTRSTSVDTNPVFRITANPAEVTLKNLTIDGLDGRSNSKPAVATKMSNPSAGNVLNLENVTITNYDFDQANNGVVLAWGESTVNMTNCTVDTDSTYDVWGGAASTVNVSGGEVGTVYLNGGTATAELTSGADVDNIVAFAGNTITADSGSNITPPADYKVKDNGDGTYSIVPKGINYGGDNYIKPDDTVAVSDSDEGKTKFGLAMDSYLNIQMLGIQKKSAIATEGGDDGIRFVTAVNSNLLKGSNIEDYGYIVVKAKEDTSVADIYSKMDNLTYDKVANSPKNIFSCYGSDNTISGDFGKFDTDTDYKYVTLSLTGTSGSNDTIAARFYVKTTDGEYYYADYIDGNNQTHGGMAFVLSDVIDNLG